MVARLVGDESQVGRHRYLKMLAHYRARSTRFAEAVNDVDGGVGLAAAGGHLDEGAAFVGGEGFFEVADGFDLRGPKIGGGYVVRSQKVCEAGVKVMLGFEPFQQRFRLVKRKD